MSEVLVNNTQLQYFLNKCDSRFATISHSHSWSNITGKPSSFPPSTHTHTKSQITDFPTVISTSNKLQYNATYMANSDGKKTTNNLRDWLADYIKNVDQGFSVVYVNAGLSWLKNWNVESDRDSDIGLGYMWAFNIWRFSEVDAMIQVMSEAIYGKIVTISLFNGIWIMTHQIELSAVMS